MTHQCKQRYLVARGGACRICRPHGWRAFRDPEEKDLMSPCTRVPIYAVAAPNKRAAVAAARARYRSEVEHPAEVVVLQPTPETAAPPLRVVEVLTDFNGQISPGCFPFEGQVALVQIGNRLALAVGGDLIIGEADYLRETARRYRDAVLGRGDGARRP